jgi:hypothetical protein
MPDPNDAAVVASTAPAVTPTAEPAKPVEPAAPAAAAAEPAKPAAPAVPEKYEFKAAKDEKVDDALASEVSGIAKDLGLDQEKAQKLYEARLAERKSTTARISDTHKGWIDATRKDPEFGGEKLKESLAIANEGFKALDLPPAFSDLLTQTGLAEHPEIIRAGYRLGKLLQNDKTRTGAAPQDAAGKVFVYPNSKHS